MGETSDVAILVDIEGVEKVTSGFGQIGNAAGNMNTSISTSAKQSSVQMDLLGNKVADSTTKMDMSQRRLAFTTAGLIGNSVQLGDILDRMAKGQVDVGRGALMLAMNFLQLGGQLTMLNSAFGEKIALQAISIAGDIREAASTAAGAVAEGIRTAASWARTLAEKAKAIALAITNALDPMGWVVLAGATAAAAVGIGLASQIPSRQFGGPINQTGPYWLHAGEHVDAKGAARGNTYNVYIQNPTFRSKEDAEFLIKALRRGVE